MFKFQRILKTHAAIQVNFLQILGYLQVAPHSIFYVVNYNLCDTSYRNLLMDTLQYQEIAKSGEGKDPNTSEIQTH